MKPCHRLPLHRLFLGLIALSALTYPVQAQTADTAPGKDSAPVATADIQRMTQNLNDLELLRPLLSLNLTQTQVDSLVATMKGIAAQWTEVKKQDDAALKALGPDIDKVHAAVLTGAPIPKEFDAKILEGQKAAAKRYNDARLDGMKRLVLHLNESLTPTQKASVEAWSVQQFGGRRIPKKYQANPSKAPKAEVQALAIAALIERTLLFDRTLTLLQQFKPASTAADPASENSAPAAPPASSPD